MESNFPGAVRDGHGFLGGTSDRDLEIAFIVAAATTRPEKLGMQFTHWSLRKLAANLAGDSMRVVTIGRERLRQILHAGQISFQRTPTCGRPKPKAA